MKIERYVLSYKDKPDTFLNESNHPVNLPEARFWISRGNAVEYLSRWGSLFPAIFTVEKVVFHLVDRDN